MHLFLRSFASVFPGVDTLEVSIRTNCVFWNPEVAGVMVAGCIANKEKSRLQGFGQPRTLFNVVPFQVAVIAISNPSAEAITMLKAVTTFPAFKLAVMGVTISPN